ncbi:hypothetical protein [Actinoplanes couchii]|nr:hypothetical protein [Actinoplanes couchii]MDR6316264.1 hypothetical protein [Actinoplanes couchii]
MEPLEAEVDALTLVCLGSFAPGVVQPAWLARHDLIPAAEADATELIVVSNEFTQFRTEWFTIEVLPERLQVHSALSAYFAPLADLVSELLRVLPSATVDAIGINHHGHFRLRDSEQYNRLGHRLAPKTMWNDLVKQPGMRKLVIQGERTDGNKGHILLTVEPSQAVQNGVFLHSNDHYSIPSGNEPSAEFAADLIAENRRQSLERSQDFFRRVIEFAREDQP